MNERPRILFVDDDEAAVQAVLPELFEPLGVDTRLRHPEVVQDRDIGWADLVVVDYFLSAWDERDDVESAARAPRDGLAAAAAMRSTLLPTLSERSGGAGPVRQVAFALWSSHLSEASFQLPEVLIPHVFARENNLEWAFPRWRVLSPEGAASVVSLARAVGSLPDRWGGASDARGQLWQVLGLEGASDEWDSEGRMQVLACHPPLHELSERSGGLAVLRWLLHRILPYPCFLLSAADVAVRLRLPATTSLENSPLAKTLSAYRYQGVLADFFGPMWWRAGIDEWLFDATESDSGDPKKVANVVNSFGIASDPAIVNPVRYVNPDLTRSSEAVAIEDTVRVQPDDWPPYAEPAFARIQDAQANAFLRSLIDPVDAYLLEEADD